MVQIQYRTVFVTWLRKKMRISTIFCVFLSGSTTTGVLLYYGFLTSRFCQCSNTTVSRLQIPGNRFSSIIQDLGKLSQKIHLQMSSHELSSWISVGTAIFFQRQNRMFRLRSFKVKLLIQVDARALVVSVWVRLNPLEQRRERISVKRTTQSALSQTPGTNAYLIIA